MLGVWIEESGGWAKNTAEIYLSKSYSKISMLTKLKYAGVSEKDLIQIYILFIRSTTEYCAVAFHSSLTLKQAMAIERINLRVLKLSLGINIYLIKMLYCWHLSILFSKRREMRCLNFSLKFLKHSQNKMLFPLHDNTYQIRDTQCAMLDKISYFPQ